MVYRLIMGLWFFHILIYGNSFVDINFVDINKEQWQLSEQDKKQLQQQKYIEKIVAHKTYHSIYLIFDLNQSIDKVFEQLLDFEKLQQHIDTISYSKIYAYNPPFVKVQMTFSKFFLNLDNFYVHKILAPNYTILWHLDQHKQSQLLTRSRGYWQLQKLKQKNTRVYYHNQLSPISWLPHYIVKYAITNASRESTQWLMRINE